MAIKFPQGRSRFGAMNAGPDSIWATFTASTTTNLLMPAHYRRRYLERFSIVSASALTGGGTLTITINKIAAGVTTALTAAFDVKTLAANVQQRIPTLLTLNDNIYTFQDGDVLQVVVAASGTVTAQPAQGISISVDWDSLS